MFRKMALAATISLSLAVPVTADPDPGAYLAGRQAGMGNDFAAALRYFTEALNRDPGNGSLRDNLVTSLVAMGQFEAAQPIAEQMIRDGQNGQMAHLALFTQAAADEDWGAIFDLLEGGHEVGPLVDGLGQAWAFVGSGEMRAALARFDEIIDTPGLRSFGQLHKALALSMIGDLEGAEAIFALPPNQGVVPSRGSVLHHINVLCRLDRFEQAEQLVNAAFDQINDPQIALLRDEVAAGTIPGLRTVSSAREGIAFLLMGLAAALQGEANDAYLLMYARAASHIDPHSADALITAGQLLDALGQYDIAADSFAQVPPDNVSFYRAELARANALQSADKPDAAIEVLTQLSRRHADLPFVHASLGDVHRHQGNFEDANRAYTVALSLYPDDAPSRWWVTYTRGITFERLGQWPEAEADFRAALALSPGQPSVLNYLGYSMVEKGINLEEALAMITQAVEARPDSGAIVDSLGWVYFQLGRFEDSVVQMERAVELEPLDPVVTDHLGDAYWMVGRFQEAEFQWQRALSFAPDQELGERIRRKLELGLQAVLEDEGNGLAELAFDNH